MNANFSELEKLLKTGTSTTCLKGTVDLSIDKRFLFLSTACLTDFEVHQIIESCAEPGAIAAIFHNN